MSWRAVTTDDVLARFNPKEQAKIEAVQGATTVLAGLLTDAIGAVRDAVVAGGGRVDQAGTVPDLLRRETITIALWDWITSIPEVNEALANKSRKAAYDKAILRLDDVNQGKIKVPVPETPVTTTTAPANAVSVPRAGVRLNTRGFGKMGAS